MRWGTKPGDPNFFAVTGFAALDTTKFEGIPTKAVGRYLYIVEFSVRDLECPDTDPIGVYHYAGIRRFLWRDRFWSEYNLDARNLMEQIGLQIRDCRGVDDVLRLRRLLDLVKAYATSTGPTNEDVIDNRESRKKTFYRAIYQIEVVD